MSFWTGVWVGGLGVLVLLFIVVPVILGIRDEWTRRKINNELRNRNKKVKPALSG